jgi:hypothetical protein
MAKVYSQLVSEARLPNEDLSTYVVPFTRDRTSVCICNMSSIKRSPTQEAR